MTKQRKLQVIGAVSLALMAAPFASAQIGKVLKVLGIWEVTRQFGPEINKSFNKLINRDPSTRTATKVVPIVTTGVSSRNAIGMVQVSGPQAAVDQVKAVAQLEQDLFGKEVRIRAMVPIAAEKATKETLKPVEQVGITGIVDFKI